MDYRKGSHTTFAIEYHFVWATKYRRKVLRGDVAERLRELVRQTCEAMEVRILSGVVSADHVHILVSAPPQWSPSDLMRRIKGRSAKRLFDDFPRLRKQFWGRHLWARGYFCVTSGAMTKEKIEEYLKHHFERKDDDNFEIE
jgi:putative transposase